MTIEFKPDCHYYAIWYLYIPPGRLGPEQDVFGAIWRNEKGGVVCRYRFKYWNSKNPFDAKDKRNWWEITSKDASSESIEDRAQKLRDELRKSMEMLADVGSGELSWLDVNGDHLVALNVIRKQHWAHAKMEWFH